MEIRFGWATDYGKQKFDVSVDETDLMRLLNDAGIPPAHHNLVNEGECFKLLEATARAFALTEAVRYADSMEKPNVAARAAEALGERKVLVAQLRTRLNIPAEEPAGEPARA